MIRPILRSTLTVWSAALVLAAPAPALSLHGAPFPSLNASLTPSAEWGDNLAVALESSSRDKLPVLMLFTGSDWCSPCKELEQSVTDTEEFLAGAKGRVHLVRLDLPHRPGIVSKEVLAKNKEHMEKYEIRGFPTLLLVGADGRPVGGFYDGDRKTDALLAACVVAKHRAAYLSELLSAAKAAQGTEAAGLFTEALTLIGNEKVVRMHYSAELEKAGQGALQRLRRQGPIEANAQTQSPEERAWKTLMDGFGRPSDEDAIAKLKPALDAAPNEWTEHFRPGVLRFLIPSMVRCNQVREALEVFEEQIDLGVTPPMRNSLLAEYRADLKRVCKEGDDAIADYVLRAINDEKFSKLLDTALAAPTPKEELASLKELTSMPLGSINSQWLRIRLGFAHEATGDIEAARSAFKEARDYPDGGVGNRNYAIEHLARLNDQ